MELSGHWPIRIIEIALLMTTRTRPRTDRQRKDLPGEPFPKVSSSGGIEPIEIRAL